MCNGGIAFGLSGLMAMVAVGCSGRGGGSQTGGALSMEKLPKLLVIVEDRDDGLWGYADYSGKVVIEPKFLFAGDFEGPYAYAIERDERRGWIDSSGRLVVPIHTLPGFHFCYDPLSVDMIANGLIAIESIRGYDIGYMDSASKLVIAARFRVAQFFSEGLAWVAETKFPGMSEWKWFCIDTEGKQKFSGFFWRAEAFAEGRAVVQTQAGGCRHIDTEGRFVGEGPWDYAEGFHEGLAYVRSEEFHGYLDLTGKPAITLPPQVKEATTFSDGMARFTTAAEGGVSKMGYIDRSGAVAVKPMRGYGHDFSEGFAYFAQADEKDHIVRKGFINKTGQYVCEVPEIVNAGLFRNGLCPVTLDKGNGEEMVYVDRTGRVLRPPVGCRFEAALSCVD